MNIFAIGDTHLSGQPPTKPMSIFGDHWLDRYFPGNVHGSDGAYPRDWDFKVDGGVEVLKHRIRY